MFLGYPQGYPGVPDPLPGLGSAGKGERFNPVSPNVFIPLADRRLGMVRTVAASVACLVVFALLAAPAAQP